MIVFIFLLQNTRSDYYSCCVPLRPTTKMKTKKPLTGKSVHAHCSFYAMSGTHDIHQIRFVSALNNHLCCSVSFLFLFFFWFQQIFLLFSYTLTFNARPNLKRKTSLSTTEKRNTFLNGSAYYYYYEIQEMSKMYKNPLKKCEIKCAVGRPTSQKIYHLSWPSSSAAAASSAETRIPL